jgi:hypothetical protein
VVQYDPNDETHREFVIATANLFAHMLGVHPLKNGLTKPGEPRWQAQYREAAWLASVVSTLPPPAYVKGKVSRLHSVRRVCIGTDYRNRLVTNARSTNRSVRSQLAATASGLDRGN